VVQRSLRDGFQQDVLEVLRPYAANLKLSCEAVEETRAGFCSGTLDEVSLMRAGSGLQLQEAFSEAARNAAIQEAGSCLKRPEFQQGLVRIAGARNRPPQFQLSNGSALEHFYLVWSQQSGSFCVAAAYSYG
jgi:hypothetical protein